MAEINQFQQTSHSGLALRSAAVAWLLLLSVTANTAKPYQEPAPVRPQEPANITPIQAGQPVARDMRGGEEHAYQITLSTGQYARIVLEQKGIDVVLELFGADKKQIVKVDNNLSGSSGIEVVPLVAEVSGAYVFTVRCLEEGASAGRYELRIDELRTATEADRTRVAAERSYVIGAQLQNERTRESRRKAVQQYSEALRLMRQAGDRRGEAMTLTNMGQLYNHLDDPQKALDHLEQAVTVWRAIGDRHLEAITLSLNGRVYFAMGETLKALDSFSLALPVMSAVGDQSGVAVTYMEIGTVYRLLGELQQALDNYLQALPLLRIVGSRRNEAIVLNNLGTVYNLIGDTPKAFHYYEQVLLLTQAINYPSLRAITLNNMGSAYNLLVEPKKALEHLDQALALTKEIGDRRTEAAVLTHSGTAYSLTGEKTKAIDYLQRALELRVAVTDRQGEATTLNHFGRAYDLWKEPQKALEYYDKALPIWQAVGDRNGEIAALFGMARAESILDEPLRASQRTEAALALINKQRTKVASRNLRATYYASVQDVFKLHIDLLMRLHRRQPTAGFDVAALKAYEQARARSLIDLLAEASADIRQGVDLNLVARERSLQQMLNSEAERQLRLFGIPHEEEKAVAVRRKIEDLLTQLQTVETALKAKSPRYAALTQPAPLGLPEIQKVVTDRETLLLEYSLGEERSYLWAVTANSFASYELPARAVIEAAARRCYELLTARNKQVKFETADEKRERVRQADAEYPQAATALSKMLLGPVAAQLGRKRLLVVPDGALEYLPFAALTAPGETSNPRRPGEVPFVPLMVEHEVTSIPSASTLAVLRREFQGRAAAEKVVAVFADPVFDKADERVNSASSRNGSGHHGMLSASAGLNAQEPAKSANELPLLPRLPYTRQEADAILALAPATGRKAALGFEANRAAAMSEDLIDYRLIHFATHSFLDSTHPELSGIALSMLDRQGKRQNGFLRAHEIFNLRLGAELVVLSACRTGLGKEVKGEGLYGMTRGFMYAGSKRVIVSLWDVQDQATARLMSDFYRGLLGPKRPYAAAALRDAQIAIWREGRWQAPYYWAGFVLQGEPK